MTGFNASAQRGIKQPKSARTMLNARSNGERVLSEAQ
jgi:hypothetical protein